MHQPIRKNLEEYLKDSASEIPAEFHAHLGECEECADELRPLEAQARLLRSLRAPGSRTTPRFYARVMERIEAQRRVSIWSVFLDRKFGLRLAVASATLVALLGTYLVTSEPGGPELTRRGSLRTHALRQPRTSSGRRSNSSATPCWWIWPATTNSAYVRVGSGILAESADSDDTGAGISNRRAGGRHQHAGRLA